MWLKFSCDFLSVRFGITIGRFRVLGFRLEDVGFAVPSYDALCPGFSVFGYP